MYRIEERVRYSEVGVDRNVGIAQILNYFQDCSLFQSEDLGIGIDYLAQLKKAWWLASWQVQVKRYPVFDEKISIGTWAYGFKGLYGLRNFDLIDEKGDRIVKANSNWFYMDLELGRPIKITEDVGKGYEVCPPLEMDYAPRKIQLPSETKELDAFTIPKSHLDTNGHVNNSKYVELAAEYLPVRTIITQMRAEYKIAAKLNDTIYPKVGKKEDNCYIVELCREDGKPYVVVEFLTK